MNFVVYCHILPHICILYNVIFIFYIVFGDFLNNPLSSGSNSVWQKTPSVSIFEFSGATGLKKGKVTLQTTGASMTVWGWRLRNPSANVFFSDGTAFSRHMWHFGPLGPKR
jgi:hypothetical protein